MAWMELITKEFKNGSSKLENIFKVPQQDQDPFSIVSNVLKIDSLLSLMHNLLVVSLNPNVQRVYTLSTPCFLNELLD